MSRPTAVDLVQGHRRKGVLHDSPVPLIRGEVEATNKAQWLHRTGTVWAAPSAPRPTERGSSEVSSASLLHLGVLIPKGTTTIQSVSGQTFFEGGSGFIPGWKVLRY